MDENEMSNWREESPYLAEVSPTVESLMQ